uniref:Uncharacterized protein n=1 Tax=Opuntia streptacantha TaxID=393608 RepID=A0A7C8ZSW4_OPUST
MVMFLCMTWMMKSCYGEHQWCQKLGIIMDQSWQHPKLHSCFWLEGLCLWLLFGRCSLKGMKAFTLFMFILFQVIITRRFPTPLFSMAGESPVRRLNGASLTW